MALIMKPRPSSKILAIFASTMVFLSTTGGQFTDPFSVMVGDKVCFDGYIMDNYCIELGTLLDNPDVVTLEGPDKHSVHCLVDVPDCNQSNYEILMDPGEGDEYYVRAFQFDDNNGKQDLIAAARRVGSCFTCDGDGDLAKGFRAEIRGTVVSTRNGDVPAMVRLESVKHSNNLDTVCSIPNKAVAKDNDSDEAKQNSQSEEQVDAVKVLSALSVIAMGILLAFSIIRPISDPPTLVAEQKYTYAEPSSSMMKRSPALAEDEVGDQF